MSELAFLKLNLRSRYYIVQVCFLYLLYLKKNVKMRNNNPTLNCVGSTYFNITRSLTPFTNFGVSCLLEKFNHYFWLEPRLKLRISKLVAVHNSCFTFAKLYTCKRGEVERYPVLVPIVQSMSLPIFIEICTEV